MADKAKKADRLENKSHKKTMTTSFGRFKDDLDKKGIRKEITELCVVRRFFCNGQTGINNFDNNDAATSLYSYLLR